MTGNNGRGQAPSISYTTRSIIAVLVTDTHTRTCTQLTTCTCTPVIKAYYKITTYVNGYSLVPSFFNALHVYIEKIVEPGDAVKWIGTAAVCRIRPLQGNSKGRLIASIYGLYAYMKSSHSYGLYAYMQSSHSYGLYTYMQSSHSYAEQSIISV